MTPTLEGWNTNKSLRKEMFSNCVGIQFLSPSITFPHSCNFRWYFLQQTKISLAFTPVKLWLILLSQPCILASLFWGEYLENLAYLQLIYFRWRYWCSMCTQTKAYMHTQWQHRRSLAYSFRECSKTKLGPNDTHTSSLTCGVGVG